MSALDGEPKGLSGFWLIGTTVVVYLLAVLAGTGLFVGLFLPLLLTLVTLQYGVRAVGVLLAIFVAGALVLHRGDVVVVVELLVLLLGLGGLVPFGWRWITLPTALWTASLLQMSGLALGVGAVWLTGGPAPSELVLDNFDQSMALFLARAQEQAQDPQALDNLAQLQEYLRWVVARTYPSLLMINFAVINLINLQFLQPVVVAMQPGRQPFAFPRRWRLHDRLFLPFIGCAVLAALDIGTVRVVAINGLLLLFFLYTLQGFGLLSHLLARTRVPVVLRTILYGILIISFQVYPLICLAGLVEGRLDLRRLRPIGRNVRKRGGAEDDQGEGDGGEG